MDNLTQELLAALKLDAGQTFTLIGAAISAMAALGMAAYALVDASKALWGGIANVGFGHILRGCQPFEKVLDAATGDKSWIELLRAQWRNGRDKENQKAMARSLVRLGLTRDASLALAHASNVDAQRLAEIADKMRNGAELDEKDAAVLGRVDMVVGLKIDTAFERADQKYRNVARVCAGIVAIALATIAAIGLGHPAVFGIVTGLLAVPIAPLAKDLTSALTAAVGAVKAMNRARHP